MNRRATPRASAAFTLIEMLASIFLTSIVISVAVGFYINLSRATEAATLRLRESRHAATILDRVARDLQSAMLLVKPADMDPLEHPWIFLAEASLLEEGADRIKFISRSAQRSRASSENPSDLRMLSYLLAPSEQQEGLFELYRFADPGLPEGLDRDFPDIDDPGARLVARDIESFSLRFRRGGGDWLDSWDSSTLVASGELPDEIEIRIALASEMESESDELEDDPPANLHTRRITLRMRPIDLEQQLEQVIAAAGGGAGAGAGAGKGGCLTVAQCIEKPANKALWQEYFDRCAADPVACARIDADRDECYTPGRLPGAVDCDR